MNNTDNSLTRRGFLATSAGTALALQVAEASAAEKDQPRQATGSRVGEITPTSAIVWARLTKHSTRNNKGLILRGRGKEQETAPTELSPAEIEGACPGAAGQVRVRYGTEIALSDAKETAWRDVDEAGDFIAQFALSGLNPATVYHYQIESRDSATAPLHPSFAGKFETAPVEKTPGNFTFCVMTCQGYPDRGHVDGHGIYPSMLALAPKFVSLTGDLVYYDNDPPRAVTPALARLHWERMFSLPRQVELLRNTGTYWLKDDHDTLKNDTWPGNKQGLLSFAEGQQIFLQQAPLAGKGYRTFRWGRDLQIWLTDGRDYRSPNNMADGPEKTIWGDEQKAWFKETVKGSDATWKILISPTPLVGPDRGGKNDNHANKGFAHEGNELRTWLQANVPENFLILCGDRHWQYHSVDPATGVREFSVGAASNEHAGGTPGEDKTFHQFHRVKGGFVSVTLKEVGGQSEITVAHRDLDGNVVHEWKKQRACG
ncbi:Phospholipase D precursor [Anatilimnocola aggregata]|uniref:Phospholipase D n=2 Tax=Anatilimnocola aggregata TaxID=2528021 RepID=A0A517YFY7_9BACT|nr:Phospholipase D precursor [Anatilimnocola aggregata]